MYGEDSYLDSYFEDRYETPVYDDYDFGYPPDYFDGADDWEDDDYDRDVDDDFPMSLEYDGPYGLSGYDEY